MTSDKQRLQRIRQQQMDADRDIRRLARELYSAVDPDLKRFIKEKLDKRKRDRREIQ